MSNLPIKFKDILFTDEEIVIHGHRYNRDLVERIIFLATRPEIENVVVDGFSGFGGVADGFMQLNNWYTIAAINHWPLALKINELNHPNCLFLMEDFRHADLLIIEYMLYRIKCCKPDINVHGWFSIECTNFSNAKGGMSRDADSRTLAEHVDRYVTKLELDCMWIENVKEFMLWGPMIPKVVALQHNRKKKVSIVVPKNVDEVEFYNLLINNGQVLCCPVLKKKKPEPHLVPWMVPDPHRKGEDYNRWKNEICDLGYTCETRLLNCANYGVPQHRVRLIMQFNRLGIQHEWPEPTHDKHGRRGLSKWLPVGPCLDLEDEGTSVLSYKKSRGKMVPRIKAVATVNRLINGISKHGKNNAAGKSQFLTQYYGSGGQDAPIDKPSPTIPTKDRIALHTLQFLSTYHSNGNGTALNQEAPAVMTKDKHPLVTVGRFIMDSQFNNQAHSIEQVARTQTANRKHFYIVNFQWFNSGLRSVDDVSNTIISRLDKSPNYLVTLETGELAIEVFDYDPPHYVKLKKYMAENGIISINMRMLNEVELLRIMSIPEHKILSKSSTANKKMIGNAVPSLLVKCLGAAWTGKRKAQVKAA